MNVQENPRNNKSIESGLTIRPCHFGPILIWQLTVMVVTFDIKLAVTSKIISRCTLPNVPHVWCLYVYYTCNLYTCNICLAPVIHMFNTCNTGVYPTPVLHV